MVCHILDPVRKFRRHRNLCTCAILFPFFNIPAVLQLRQRQSQSHASESYVLPAGVCVVSPKLETYIHVNI
jgi:hypothetical protein